MKHDWGSTAYERLRRTLEEALFHTPKQLRHTAESAGFFFVPTELVSATDGSAEFILRPRNLPVLRVRAYRRQPWHPFHVTSIEEET